MIYNEYMDIYYRFRRSDHTLSETAARMPCQALLYVGENTTIFAGRWVITCENELTERIERILLGESQRE